MRIVVHLSDLHFGRADSALLGPLRARVRALHPHLVAVSGDLTQRAKSWQFRAARAFLDTLPKPQIVVPGNHDVPLYNVFRRFFRPFERYRRYISDVLEPEYFDEELAVIGVSTARSLTIKGGRINQEQVARIRARICDLPDRITKILVTHHPFDVASHQDPAHIVGRAAMAATGLAECGVDILLSGHLHARHTSHAITRYRVAGFSALLVQAGTATSTRLRGEANSFNVLHIADPRLRIEHYGWDPARCEFALSEVASFERTPTGWVPQPLTLSPSAV